MRRVLLATVMVVAVAVVSFGVGWVASSSDDRTSVHRPPAVAKLKPLPVPRVIIPNGPWADPQPVAPTARPPVPRLPRGFLGELASVLDFPPVASVVD